MVRRLILLFQLVFLIKLLMQFLIVIRQSIIDKKTYRDDKYINSR
jgi:hypothetical protein